MFSWDPGTNRLSLQPGQSCPWLRPLNRANSDNPKCWLYCNECATHLFTTGKKVYGHIPFRDKASQGSMKRPAKKEPVETQEEPEIEPAVDTQPAAPAAESDLVEDDDEDDGGAAEEQQGAEDPRGRPTRDAKADVADARGVPREMGPAKGVPLQSERGRVQPRQPRARADSPALAGLPDRRRQ